jgi:hypothetical protein
MSVGLALIAIAALMSWKLPPLLVALGRRGPGWLLNIAA